MIGLVIGNSRALLPLSEGWGSHNSGPLGWVSYILGLNFNTCVFQYCSLLASSPCMASEASWRDRKSQWRSHEGRTNLSHPSHSHLLLRAALVWLLVTPPNGELVHWLLVLRRRPREMQLSVFYCCICTFPVAVAASIHLFIVCCHLCCTMLLFQDVITLTGPHNMLID